MAVFADTGYFIALLVRSDRLHPAAVELTQRNTEPLLTTEYVFVELLSALSRPPWRTRAIGLMRYLGMQESAAIVPSSPSLFARGVARYEKRSDQCWSLVDCISFVCMEEHGLHTALSADHHFEQAGFSALMRV